MFFDSLPTHCPLYLIGCLDFSAFQLGVGSPLALFELCTNEYADLRVETKLLLVNQKEKLYPLYFLSFFDFNILYSNACASLPIKIISATQ